MIVRTFVNDIRRSMLIELPDVTPYPTTGIMTGQETEHLHIVRSALFLYNDWCVDRRWIPEDVCKLVMWAKENRHLLPEPEDL